MTTDAPLVVASWGAPPWVEECTTDEDAVIYSRVLGRTADPEGGDLIVELAQRDELSVTANTITITRLPAYLRVGGQMIAGKGTARFAPFARMLTTANDLTEHHPDADAVQFGTPDRHERIAS